MIDIHQVLSDMKLKQTLCWDNWAFLITSFYCGAATQRGSWPTSFLKFLDHTTTHHSR